LEKKLTPVMLPPGALNAYMQYGGMFKKANVDWGHPMSPSDPAGMMHHNENFMVVILLLGIVAGAIAVFLERPSRAWTIMTSRKLSQKDCRIGRSFRRSGIERHCF
jgi:hypothetical protein